MRTIEMSAERASEKKLAVYGMFLPRGVWLPGLDHPFYDKTIVQGRPIPFRSDGEVAIRTAEVSWRGAEVVWMERHRNCTQVLYTLGEESIALVLGKPNHQDGESAPDIAGLTCFLFRPGEGVLLHVGTWHSFPFTMGWASTCLSIISCKVIGDLVREPSPVEIFSDNIEKIDVRRRLGRITIVDLVRRQESEC